MECPRKGKGFEPPFSFRLAEKKTAVHGQKKRTLLSKLDRRSSSGIRRLGKIALAVICSFSVGRGKDRVVRNHLLSRESELQGQILNGFEQRFFPRISLRYALLGA